MASVVTDSDERVSRIIGRFKPEEHGLPPSFVLTKFTGMKGCGCKVPRAILLELLKTFGEEAPVIDDGVGIGLDSCVIPLRHKGLSLVQTTDFFYPLVDDPYIMGRITCANVLSDLYAMGIVDCDNMLMLLGVSVEFNDKERDTVVGMFIKGFKDSCDEAETKVRGGQTVRCPWLLLGGVATSVASDDEMIRIDRAKPGDVLVLTKPIGTQMAVNSYEWLKTNNGRVEEYGLNADRLVTAFQQAGEQMSRLNRNAARCLHKFKAHASTDVTGFGILGHADNLCRAQKDKLKFIIDKLPIIEYMDEVSRSMPNKNGFNLFRGTSAETSGGLLIALDPQEVKGFSEEMLKLDGFPVYVVGRVVELTDGSNHAVIDEGYTVETVPSRIHK